MYYLDKYDRMLCVDCGANDEDNIQCKDPVKGIYKCHSCGKVISDTSIYVRKYPETGLWKLYRKIGPRQYELHPDYLNYGFKNKAHAERRAREIEQGEKL